MRLRRLKKTQCSSSSSEPARETKRMRNRNRKLKAEMTKIEGMRNRTFFLDTRFESFAAGRAWSLCGVWYSFISLRLCLFGGRIKGVLIFSTV